MIELDADQKTPLYEQLYAALADEIRTGQRAPGTPLPGRRTMAAQQGVSVNTVDAAYQMLAAEGLAEPRPRSGFYVQKTYGMLHSRARRAPAAPAPQPPAAPQPVYDLSTGSVDTALFPARSWGRIQKELLYQRPELLQRGEMQGDAPLRTQIAEYLSVYRGVECTPEQIVVGAGIEYLLGCLAHLFSDGMAAIENPGYFRTRTVLQNSGIPCTLVDIDREGLPADALEKSGANLCYLTPSHHFPTGVTMPATRRAQLLAWAAAHVALRLALSSALRWDEAEQTLWSQHLAWGYGTQPPLYTWLQWGLNAVLGPSVLSLAVLKHALLALTYLFMGLAARALLPPRAAWWAAASMVMLPALGSSRPSIILNRVLLPAPLWPIRP